MHLWAFFLFWNSTCIFWCYKICDFKNKIIKLFKNVFFVIYTKQILYERNCPSIHYWLSFLYDVQKGVSIINITANMHYTPSGYYHFIFSGMVPHSNGIQVISGSNPLERHFKHYHPNLPSNLVLVLLIWTSLTN